MTVPALVFSENSESDSFDRQPVKGRDLFTL